MGLGVLLRWRRIHERRWSREEARRSRPARMKAELVRPEWKGLLCVKGEPKKKSRECSHRSDQLQGHPGASQVMQDP